jgi:hypothetical protein
MSKMLSMLSKVAVTSIVLCSLMNFMIPQSTHAKIPPERYKEICAWQAVATCSAFGIVTGGLSGIACSALSVYVCGNLLLTPEEEFQINE